MLCQVRVDVPRLAEEGASSSTGTGWHQRVFLCPAHLTLGQLLTALQGNASCAAAGSILTDIQRALQVPPRCLRCACHLSIVVEVVRLLSVEIMLSAKKLPMPVQSIRELVGKQAPKSTMTCYGHGLCACAPALLSCACM